jgi:hypothetical protein
MTVLLDTEVSVVADSYDTLLVSIGQWLDRADLSTMIPKFVEMAHRQFNRTLFPMDRETMFEDTVTDGYVLPADIYQLKSIEIVDDDDTPMEQVPYATLKAEAEYECRPARFAIHVGRLYVSPQPEDGATMKIAYTARIPMLGTFQASNWLLEKHPDAYIYGALLQATAFLDATDPRISLWSAALERTIAEIEDTGIKARTASGPLVMRPA